MRILNACYLPESARGRIDETITLVNAMRIVLDECLGSSLGKPPDRNYYSTYRSPYAFVEVTGEIR